MLHILTIGTAAALAIGGCFQANYAESSIEAASGLAKPALAILVLCAIYYPG